MRVSRNDNVNSSTSIEQEHTIRVVRKHYRGSPIRSAEIRRNRWGTTVEIVESTDAKGMGTSRNASRAIHEHMCTNTAKPFDNHGRVSVVVVIAQNGYHAILGTKLTEQEKKDLVVFMRAL